MSSSRKSIIRKADTQNTGRRSGPKRLSFAPSPELEEEETIEEENNVSRFESEVTPTDQGCNLTSFGLCYDRKAIPKRGQTQHDTTTMRKCQRNNFASLLNFSTLSGSTANVLIVGERIFSEKLKAYLLEVHSKRHMTKRFKCKLDLDIKYVSTLTPAMTPTAHFIIFPFLLETYESMKHLTKILKSFSKDTLPSNRMIIVTISSSPGCSKMVVDLEQFHELLFCNQLITLPWKEEGRHHEKEIKKILEFIYKSIGWHRGASLLLTYTLQLSGDYHVEYVEA
ncbi:uncharacterized protein LOC123519056 [Portunus trituberculatus]|uniref:uncharacterized protein LOC123519056 n=1 Tax=Portunus trituberculatus TaxID=210409 RepID=UPI001E1CE781|nr:uncharacterized protein LOC123519056 [Portunus trituberculatus]